MRGSPGSARLLLVLAAAVAVVTGAVVAPQALRPADGGGLLGSMPDPLAQGGATSDAGPGSEASALQAPAAVDPPGVSALSTSAPALGPILLTRVPKPELTGPRRVGIQAGHWQTANAPPELRGLLTQTGTSWNGINEVAINLDIAGRVKRILEPRGIVVDILPTTITPGYVADAVVALHGDGDGTGESSGFKMAFSTRRTPYEAALLDSIKTHYAAATGLSYDSARISRQMTFYYLFGWWRNKYSTAPHTPSVIVEMGYLSHDDDRGLMMDRPDVVAGGIAEGIIRFLDAHPREKLFGQDLLIQLPPRRPPPTPRA